MIDESTINMPGGSVGLITFDHQPKATPARIRPFVWAYLLLRGAVRRCEVEGALTGHVQDHDIRAWSDPLERTELQVIIDDVLATMVFEGLLRVNQDLYVLTPQSMSKAVSTTCQLNAQLPDHLLMEIDGRQ